MNSEWMIAGGDISGVIGGVMPVCCVSVAEWMNGCRGGTSRWRWAETKKCVVHSHKRRWSGCVRDNGSAGEKKKSMWRRIFSTRGDQNVRKFKFPNRVVDVFDQCNAPPPVGASTGTFKQRQSTNVLGLMCV